MSECNVLNTIGIDYSQVCGQLRGYQFGTPDGFSSFSGKNPRPTIDDVYVDGVSIITVILLVNTFGLMQMQQVFMQMTFRLIVLAIIMILI